MLYESDIESRLVRGIEKLGGQCLKYGVDGWPDRVAVLPGGLTVWVELKRPRGRVAELQRWRKKQLQGLGHRVETVWDMDQCDRLLRDLEP